MGFRENLKNELIYKGMLVKELADKSGVPKGTIDHYLAEKSTEPIAINAVKIAKALNVSVEYLVTGKISAAHKESLQLTEAEVHNYKKLHELIEACKNLSQKQIQLLKQIAENFEKNVEK